MDVAGCPYVFVSQGHPAINLLRANSELLGSDIDTMAKIGICVPYNHLCMLYLF